MTATLPEVRAALEQEWAAFTVDRNTAGKLTQQGVWRRDNPGEWSKLQAYRAGTAARPNLATALGRQMVEHVDAYRLTAPPAPPTAILVAPITVTQQGGSDQRVCLFNSDGSLRPGVTRLANGEYTDQSNAKYAADGGGLENSSVRTKLPEGAFGLVKAKEMDSRSACECPTAGSPADNTGSWTV